MTSMDAEIKPKRISFFCFRQDKAFKSQKESCVICFNTDIDHVLMFSVDNCYHRFCFNCVKQHIKVKLLDGTIPNCLQHQCKSKLSIGRCGNLLTRELRSVWERRIKENSTPLADRVYCPYPTCSYLMSKRKLQYLLWFIPGIRICWKCKRSFCLNCRVPWHKELSCNGYKNSLRNRQNDDAKLISLAKFQKWRQCKECKHMVERNEGCYNILCRCGYSFCYKCGKEESRCNH